MNKRISRLGVSRLVSDAREQLRHESWSCICRRITDDAATLARHEIALGQAEIMSGLPDYRASGLAFTRAALLGLFAVAALTAFVIAALAIVLPLWLAALVIGVASLALAAVVCILAVLQRRLRNARHERLVYK